MADSDPESPPEDDSAQLSASQRARIERNRQKALLLRQSRLQEHPFCPEAMGKYGKKFKGPVREIDTGAGFYIEESPEQDKRKVQIVHPEGPLLEMDNLLCNECGKEFMESYFYTKFDELICDVCRENNEKFPLITKSEAKKKYLLKDVDLEMREPPLKFVVKKNPHYHQWGEMKLYLESQVIKRSLEVWGNEDKIEEAKEQRSDNRDKAKRKKFDKKIKDLRMSVRSSLKKKETVKHEHEFGPEQYDEEEDEYTKSCKTCSYSMTYEKM